MHRTAIVIILSLFCHLTSFCQADVDLFRGTFYSNFFGFKMQNLTASSNTYKTTISYLGKNLDKPRNYELHGQLSRELKGVEFKYQLIKVKAPKNLKLIKNYYVHTRNFSKYKHFFDTLSGDWISDSLEVLDSLITLDIHSSSNMKANEIGIYFHSKTNKYYIQSTNYCALVKIHTTSKLKVRRIMKKYGYTIDKREMCLDLMNTMQYCDYVEQSNKQNLDLDINCYFLYSY